jgi:DNA-binding IclR family transcriptional regulator
LRAELDAVFEQGYTIDDEEIAPGLRRMAVPLDKCDGMVVAAISVSQALSSRGRLNDPELAEMLTETGLAIENEAFAGA